MIKPYLMRLMSRSKLNWKWKIDPEQKLSIEVADMLRERCKDGTCIAVWTHIANEGKRSRIVAMILKAMGLIPGAGDFVFVWKSGGAYIELKVPGGDPYKKLSDNQKDYRQWCIDFDVPYEVLTSVEDVEEALIKWGAIIKSKG